MSVSARIDGNHLRQERERFGLSQAEVATEASCNRAVLSLYETGTRKVSQDEAKKILSAIYRAAGKRVRRDVGFLSDRAIVLAEA